MRKKEKSSIGIFSAMLKSDFHRAFISTNFVIGIIFTVIIFFFGSVGMSGSTVSAMAVFNNSFKYNNMINMLFLTATFAYSSSFCLDWQNQFILPLIIRSSKGHYTISKCITTAVAGGMTIMIGAGVFIGYICIVQPSILPSMYEIEIEFFYQAFGDLLVKGQVGLFFLSYLYVIFLQGAFFSTLGLMMSSYIPNRYVAYVSPFALGFILNKISNILDFPIWLDPVKLSTVRILDTPASTILVQVTTAFLSFILICDFLFVRTVKRRISNG